MRDGDQRRVLVPAGEPPLFQGEFGVVMHPAVTPGAQRDPVTCPFIRTGGPQHPVVNVQFPGVPVADTTITVALSNHLVAHIHLRVTLPSQKLGTMGYMSAIKEIAARKARRSSVLYCGHYVLVGQLIIRVEGHWICKECAWI